MKALNKLRGRNQKERLGDEEEDSYSSPISDPSAYGADAFPSHEASGASSPGNSRGLRPKLSFSRKKPSTPQGHGVPSPPTFEPPTSGGYGGGDGYGDGGGGGGYAGGGGYGMPRVPSVVHVAPVGGQADSHAEANRARQEQEDLELAMAISASLARP